MVEESGFLTLEEIKQVMGYPTEERMKAGPVAIAECTQEIPCNPCEAACKFGAIQIGIPITKQPMVDFDKCTGCKACIAQCSGLAIFVIDKSYSRDTGTVTFPHEYFPIPEEGQTVKAVNREGKAVCQGKVIRIQNPTTFDHTPVLTVAVPMEYVEIVRGIKRQTRDPLSTKKGREIGVDDDMLVCRCEEVTVAEVKRAIQEGARDVNGVKLRTRAGMGLCQGRSCEKLVQQIIRQELGASPEEIGSSTARPPVRPITFGSLAGGEDNA